MNKDELKIEAIKHGIPSFKKLAEFVGIPLKRFYYHLKTGNFTREEILQIARALSLTSERIIDIFFVQKVS